MTAEQPTGIEPDDHVGDYALQRLETEYYRLKCRSMYRSADEIREAICLARGWEFKR